jgi:hypothetical protein
LTDEHRLRRSLQPSEGAAMINTLLAVLAVLAVMAVHAVCKLLLMPFRILRSLFRHNSKPGRVTAG